MKITIHVTPNARKSEVVEDSVDLFGVRTLRVKVAAKPQDGAANEAVIKLLSEYFKISKSMIEIVKGHTSRTKIIEIQ